MVASLVFSGGAIMQWIDRVNGAGEDQYVAPVVKTWTWWQSGGIEFGLGQHVDGLTLAVLGVVAFISTLVQIYSVEYLRGDRRYTHFFASLTLFSAGMMNMVRRREHDPADPRLGDHGPLLLHAHRPLVGGGREQPGRAQGVLHHPHR